MQVHRPSIMNVPTLSTRGTDYDYTKLQDWLVLTTCKGRFTFTSLFRLGFGL